jgi:hypothetical protein
VKRSRRAPAEDNELAAKLEKSLAAAKRRAA